MNTSTDRPGPQMRILSLGAGVQSTTLALLSAEGVLPKLDAAIFADTGWEPRAVYDHLDRLEREVLRPAGIPLYRVNNGNLRDDVLNPNKMRSIPAYTASQAYEVTVVDEWGVCPDESCGWRTLREVRENPWPADEAPILFHAVAVDLEDMSGLFDSVVMVPERATLTELDSLAEQWEPDSDGEDDGINDAAQVAAALRRADLNRLPDPHDACRSMGRVVTREHVEIRRDYGMLGRKCTQQYKLRPILEQVRLLLGAEVGEEKVCRWCDGCGQRVAPWRAKRGEDVVGDCSVCEGLGTISRVGQPPTGVWVEQWIGFSTDEVERVSGKGDTRYSRSRHPLLELNMSREQCKAYLKKRGWENTQKSACEGCPFHGNAEWRRKRDTDPESWKNAIEFDKAYRTGPGMNHERYLHISCRPLDEAPIDRVQRRENQQVDMEDVAYEERLEEGDPDGCSPWACRSGEPVAALDERDLDEREAS